MDEFRRNVSQWHPIPYYPKIYSKPAPRFENGRTAADRFLANPKRYNKVTEYFGELTNERDP